jgi:hypothetical protein
MDINDELAVARKKWSRKERSYPLLKGCVLRGSELEFSKRFGLYSLDALSSVFLTHNSA